MATLRSRLSFARRLPSSSSRGSSASRKGFSAATARRLGDLQVTVQNVPPGKTPRASAPPRGSVVMPKQTAPPSKSGPSVSFGAPPEEEMSISASEDEQSAGEAGASAEQRPSAVAVPSETDAELSAMLLRAAEGIGVEVPMVPPPDPSRLDDWFLGTRSAAPSRLPPVPFFPEVHDELVRAWRAPYSARSRPTSSALATLDGGAARGAYRAAGQAATALHAMATLQVYQAKALKELHRGSPDQVVMQELRAATDLALRETKVTARSLGQVMSTLVVQERHLWLNLVQMADVDKARFLAAPVSQAGLFGDTVEDFAQQFSAVQKQTEAIKHILPRRETTRTSPGAQPQPARRRGRPPAAPKKEPGMKTALQDVHPSGISPLPLPLPAGCPTAVTSVNAPLIPLATRLAACLPAQVQGRPFHFCPLRHGCLCPATQSSLRGFTAPTSSCPRRAVGYDQSWIFELPFKMLTSKRILSCVRHQDWTPTFTFAFEGRAYQYKVLPFGLSLSPRVFTKVAESALNPLWRKGIRILNYLDDWLVMALVTAYSARGQTLLSYGPEHVVVHTDASTTGWGALCNGQAASGSWTGPRLLWHINCLELLAVLLALRRFLPMLRHKHVLVRTDNTATVAYINRQGGLRSRRMSQLARHLLLWSQTRLKSLRAVHIPGELNRAADQLSRQPTHPGEWRLHPQTVQLIWSRFGEAQIDLFASPESSHCQLYLSEAPLSRDALAHSWPPGPNLLAQILCKIREDGEQVLLVAPYWPTRTCPSLEDPLEEGPSFSGDGHNLAPASRSMEPTRVASGRDTAVIETITQQAYALRTHRDVRSQWCFPFCKRSWSVGCPLQLSTLIAAYHDAVDGASIGKHQLVVRFLKGVRRVNPPRPHLVPSWDLSVALRGLRGPPFEPLVSVELKFLSLKTALLTALASIKRVGDLQAFSVNEACLEFGPTDSHVVLRPRPGYVPKVPTTPFRDQVVNLQALPPEEADQALALLCPVDRTRSFRRSEQLFVCFGGQQKGNAVSKQRLAHWVVDAISLAYESQGEPVASSYVLAHGASLADICRAAGWATPNTFARFYNLR
ncbi:hypothetical protein M9458_055035, partial [Cirrhinus mrigala]